MTALAHGPGFWRVVWLLVGAARKRAVGRVRTQIKIKRRRGGVALRIGPTVGFLIGCFIGVLVHGVAAFEVATAVSTAARVEIEASGKLAVDDWFLQRILQDENAVARNPWVRAAATRDEEPYVQSEAKSMARERGGDAAAFADRLRAKIRFPKTFVDNDFLWRRGLRLPDLFALFITLWWALALVCQGEGADFDTQRSRHPMWEWLFSHPAPPAAIFFAEMLSPIAANPIYLTAPLFPGVLFGLTYGWAGGLAGAALVGVPLTLALAALGKAIEIRALLTLPPRARGAALGIMGWFGFAGMAGMVMLGGAIPTIANSLAPQLLPLAAWPWPPTHALMGLGSDGRLDFARGVAIALAASAALIVGAVYFSVRSARLGLAGRFPARAARRASDAAFQNSRDPLYRKEWLWFRRDGGALVQAVLVPLSLAGLQVFNLRGLISLATFSWSSVAGVAVLFGTYFLLILGPKSLLSEGQALWIAMTWPRGLESLLRAKARLWAIVATTIVGLALLWAFRCFPADGLSIAGVAALWVVFARTLAERSVTLVTTTSSSGEPEKIPSALRYGAWLGTLSFAIGVLTRQWSLAIAGVVFSTLTAAAMWQEFRYRLPFLFDPWSQTLPPAPTLLNAMIAITGMIEAIAIFSAIAAAAFGAAYIVTINAALYGLCAIAACYVVIRYLRARGVALADIWLWGDREPRPRLFRELDSQGRRRALMWLAAGVGIGVTLGAAEHLYLAALQLVPEFAQAITAGREQLDTLPYARPAYFVMAVIFAPFAEEFLFRGLLYRALDREWGGLKAVVGAAVFFAIYHPFLSWAPVAALGAANALLFKRSGGLAPAIAAHMTYNAIVLLF